MRPPRFLLGLAAALALCPPAWGASVSPLVVVSGRVQAIPAGDTALFPAPATDGSIILTPGSAPSGTPTNGALWTTTAGLFARINGTTVGPFGTGTGCSPSGSQYQVLVVNSAGTGCTADTEGSLNAGALSLGASGTLGSITMGNATSGTVTLEPATGALGTVTDLLPPQSGTLVIPNRAQSWSAPQTFASGNLVLQGSSTGATTLVTEDTSATNYTLLLQAVTDTVAVLGTAQAFTAPQTFDASDFILAGSGGANQVLQQTTSGGVITVGQLSAASLANIAANSMLGNWTNASAAPSADAMPSCSTSTDALDYTTNTGIGCQTFGTVVTQNTGTSGANVPLMNGANTWSGLQTDTADHAVSGAAGTFRHYYLQTAGTCRWGWQEDSTAESGSNAGTNLELIACSDAGSVIFNPIVVTRSTGLVSVSEGLELPRTTVGGLPACGSTTAGELYTVTDASSPTWHGTLTGGSTTFSGAMCNSSVWIAF
jgi:hypothetical protein